MQFILAFGTEYLVAYEVAALAASAAGTYYSYSQSQQQQKQVKAQGEMNQQAMAQEQARKAAETAANQQRLAVQQKRARAQQAAQQASTGFQLDTGSPLAIMADTYATQAQEQADLTYQGDVQQRALGWERTQAKYNAQQQIAGLKTQQTAGLISGVGDIASAGFTTSSNTARPAKTTGYGNS